MNRLCFSLDQANLLDNFVRSKIIEAWAGIPPQVRTDAFLGTVIKFCKLVLDDVYWPDIVINLAVIPEEVRAEAFVDEIIKRGNGEFEGITRDFDITQALETALETVDKI